MSNSGVDSKVYPLVMTAVMMCMVMVSILLLRIPIPFTQGYVNLSDAMVFLAVIILGYKYGAVAAGVGSMLGDLLCGYAMWAPWSLGIKAGMAIIFGLIVQAALSRSTHKESGAKTAGDKGFIFVKIIGMIAAGSFMAAGYYAAEGIMYGNWIVAALGVPWNIAQFGVGIVVALAISEALSRTAVRNRMTYAAADDRIHKS